MSQSTGQIALSKRKLVAFFNFKRASMTYTTPFFEVNVLVAKGGMVKILAKLS